MTARIEHSRPLPKRAGQVRRLLLTAISLVVAVIGLLRACSHKIFGEPVGAVCYGGSDCQSGDCLITVIVGRCTEPCHVSEDCSGGARCVDTAGARYCVVPEPGGANCHNSTECLSDACIGTPSHPLMPVFEGTCAAPCGSSGAGRCPDRYYCAKAGTRLGFGITGSVLSRPACLEQKALGLACEADDECETGECTPWFEGEGDDSVPAVLQGLKRCTSQDG